MLSIIEKRRVEPTLLYQAGSKSSKAPAKKGKLGIALWTESIFMLTIIIRRHELINWTMNIFHIFALISALSVLFFSNLVRSFRIITTIALINGTATTIAIEIDVYLRYEEKNFLHGLISVPGNL